MHNMVLLSTRIGAVGLFLALTGPTSALYNEIDKKIQTKNTNIEKRLDRGRVGSERCTQRAGNGENRQQPAVRNTPRELRVRKPIESEGHKRVGPTPPSVGVPDTCHIMTGGRRTECLFNEMDRNEDGTTEA